MTKFVHGTIHGRNNEIAEDLGLSEGQEVEVQARAIPEVAHLSVGAAHDRISG